VREGLPWPRALTLLALGTVVLARGLANALPGAFAGTDAVIRIVVLAADYASQLCALSFAVLSVRTMFGELLGTREVSLKLLALVATLATVSAAYVSADAAFRPHHVWLVGMGASLVVLGLVVAIRALGVAHLRGIGLVVLAVALSGAGHLFARWLLVDLDSKLAVRMFFTARVVATAAFAAEIVALGLAVVWYATGVPKGAAKQESGFAQAHWLWASGALLLFVSSALVLADGPEGWRLLIGRTLSALGTHPDPLLPARALYLVDLLVIALCAAALLPWARRASDRAALSFLLLSRASFDVPIGALLALLGVLTVLAELPRRTPTPSPGLRQFGSRAEARR
jgi:hypothetical protein